MKEDRMIYIKSVDRYKLQRVLECSQPAISSALRFRSNSVRAYQIRRAAMNLTHGYYFGLTSNS